MLKLLFCLCLHLHKLTVYVLLYTSLCLVPNLTQMVLNSTMEGLQFNHQKLYASHPALLYKKVIHSLTSSIEITLHQHPPTPKKRKGKNHYELTWSNSQ